MYGRLNKREGVDNTVGAILSCRAEVNQHTGV